MRLLLVGILTFIPWVAQAKSLDDAGDSDFAFPAVTSFSASDDSDPLFNVVGRFRNCRLARGMYEGHNLGKP